MHAHDTHIHRNTYTHTHTHHCHRLSEASEDLASDLDSHLAISITRKLGYAAMTKKDVAAWGDATSLVLEEQRGEFIMGEVHIRILNTALCVGSYIYVCIYRCV